MYSYYSILPHIPFQVKYIRIDGGTPPASRPELVASFQNDPTCKVALLSLTAAGVGITLTAADIVVMAELHWYVRVLLSS